VRCTVREAAGHRKIGGRGALGFVRRFSGVLAVLRDAAGGATTLGYPANGELVPGAATDEDGNEKENVYVIATWPTRGTRSVTVRLAAP
jgi:hypothetical protein